MKSVEPLTQTAEVQVQGVSPACARVARALLLNGPLTAAEVADELHLTSAAVRRHLETLISRSYVQATDDAPFGPLRAVRRGRPAKFYSITARGRDAFESAYDDMAVEALRYLRDRHGADELVDFARERAAAAATKYRAQIDEQHQLARASQLAEVLTAEGYAATVEQTDRGIQLCQHHCPVAHAAEEFPQLCEAEREVFSELLGARVMRLSTIATGADVCTAVIPQHEIDHPTPAHPIKPTDRPTAEERA